MLSGISKLKSNAIPTIFKRECGYKGMNRFDNTLCCSTVASLEEQEQVDENEMKENITIEFNNEDLVSVKNFSKICRICLMEMQGTPIVDLFFEDKRVTDILSSHLVIEVNLGDFLPQNICNHCNEEILKMCSLIEKCQKADAFLRSYFKFTLEDEQIEINDEEVIKEDSRNLNENKVDVVVQDIEVKDRQIGVNCVVNSLENNMDPILNSLHNDVEISKRQVEVVHNNSDVERDEIADEKDKDEQCPTCLKYFAKKRLKRHIIMVHTDKYKFECQVCFKTIKSKAHLKRHMMIHTGEHPYICDICGKAYSRPTGFAIHKKTHVSYEEIDPETGVRCFACSHCGKVFRRSANYNAHIKKHEKKVNEAIEKEEKASTEQNEKLHSCSICKKSYKIKSSLFTHQLEHCEKAFLCNTCGKRFVRKAALQQHLVTHAAEKPHICKICHKSFARIVGLEIHSLIHTRQKLHVCSICEKSFTQANHLKYHMLTHTGEKAYECTYCGKRFAVKGNLTVHVRTHTGERPYMCTVCDKKFYDSSSKKRHEKRHRELTF